MATTLEQIVPAGMRNAWHLYAEWRGLRFYMGSYKSYADAEVMMALNRCSHYSMYITDRCDGTSINGDNWEFQRRYREWDEAINQPFRMASPRSA